MKDHTHHMNIFDLLKEIRQKEKEYQAAIKAEKEFWEVEKIFKQNKALKQELREKVSDLIISPNLV